MADFTRRAFVAGAAAAGVSPIIGVARAQQGYPAGLTIKFIVGFPAGGAQDIVGRIIADRLGALWNATTVVENVAGAGGNIGMDRVAKGPADGTQICIIPPGIATNQFLYPRLSFDPEKDILPLGMVASVPNLLCVQGSAINSVAELIATQANPGKAQLRVLRQRHHYHGRVVRGETGGVWVHVARAATALNDLSARIGLFFDNILSSARRAQARVKPLAITLAQRSSLARIIRRLPTRAGLLYDVMDGVMSRRHAQGDCDKIEADMRPLPDLLKSGWPGWSRTAAACD